MDLWTTRNTDRGEWRRARLPRCPQGPQAEQKQKQRTIDALPKPDKLIRYRQDLVGWLVGEALPAVDLWHDDLAGGEQRPEQHGGGFGAGHDGLGLDAALEILVQAVDGV
jgi:hypothetical protein